MTIQRSHLIEAIMKNPKRRDSFVALIVTSKDWEMLEFVSQNAMGELKQALDNTNLALDNSDNQMGKTLLVNLTTADVPVLAGELGGTIAHDKKSQDSQESNLDAIDTPEEVEKLNKSADAPEPPSPLPTTPKPGH